MQRTLLIVIVLASVVCCVAAETADPDFRQALENGRLANEGYVRCHRFVEGWLTARGPQDRPDPPEPQGEQGHLERLGRRGRQLPVHGADGRPDRPAAVRRPHARHAPHRDAADSPASTRCRTRIRSRSRASPTPSRTGAAHLRRLGVRQGRPDAADRVAGPEPLVASGCSALSTTSGSTPPSRRRSAKSPRPTWRSTAIMLQALSRSTG